MMQILRKIYRLWMSLSHILGRIMSTILLSMLWILVFGIYAIILKISGLCSGKHFRETYWIDVSKEKPDMRFQF